MQNLKLVTSLKLAIGAMLVIALTATALTIWSSSRAAFLSDRMNLAHQVYEAHLSLSSNAYQLFKQYGDALIIGDRDQGSGERELTAAVRSDISRIRALVAEEIDLVGSEESEELEALARIETMTNRLIGALETYRTGYPDEAFRTGWSNLSTILDGAIDRDFRELIDKALAEELEEVVGARTEIARTMAVNRRLALVAAFGTLLAAAAAILLVERRIRVPAARVVDGVERFGAGDYRHRIGLGGRHELSQIAQALDGMAAKIEDRARSIMGERAELERQVADRTAQLETMLERAQQSERNRRTLLSDVSHELKTPLTIIRGEADIALRRNDTEPDALRHALQRTRDAASHTARIVDDLLFIARSEEGKPRIATETTDLASLLESVARTFAPEVEVVGAGQKAIVLADPGRIRQAILILYDNARRHGGDTVAMRLDRTPDGWRVAVEDDGPGMTEDEKVQAFERFHPGGRARPPSETGVGLGLPVARAIIDAHGGTIALSDRPGNGLIASFTLPALGSLRMVS